MLGKKAEKKRSGEIFAPLYKPVEAIPLGKGRFSFEGVAHIGRTFERYKEEFDSKIAAAPFVILEYASPSMFALAEDIWVRDGELYDSELDSVHAFFAGIIALAIKHEKDIVVVNPDEKRRWGSRFIELNAMMAGNHTALGASAIAAGMFGRLSAQDLKRRELIKAILSAAPAAFFGQATLYGSEWMNMTSKTLSLIKRYENTDTPITLEDAKQIRFIFPHVMLWRDLATSEATRALFDAYSSEVEGKTVPGFYGLIHMGEVDILRNGSRLSSKAFPWFEAAGDRTIRRFRYDRYTGFHAPEAERLPY